MSDDLNQLYDDLCSINDEIRYPAFCRLLQLTEQRVDWIYDRFEILLKRLENENSYQRSIGIMLLCNLAKSDTKGKMKNLLPRILEHCADEKFITSRQTIQNLWKIALVNKEYEKTVVDHLKDLYRSCETEKHYNLLRQDILTTIARITAASEGEELRKEIEILVEEEPDTKNRAKYKKALKDILA